MLYLTRRVSHKHYTRIQDECRGHICGDRKCCFLLFTFYFRLITEFTLRRVSASGLCGFIEQRILFVECWLIIKCWMVPTPQKLNGVQHSTIKNTLQYSLHYLRMLYLTRRVPHKYDTRIQDECRGHICGDRKGHSSKYHSLQLFTLRRVSAESPPRDSYE